ncbi:MAG: flagellar motor protein MotB [Verrucomicrobiota bacterium]
MAKKSEHHGGAWKVAYADFVTAMMALFIVLWILAPDPIERQKVVYDDEVATDGAPGGDKDTIGVKDSPQSGEDSSTDQNKKLEMISDELIRMLKMADIPNEKPVEVKPLQGVLKVTMFERTNQPVFKKGTAELEPWGDFVIQNLSMVAKRYGMRLYIDGHTAKGSPGGEVARYGPWELSLDRANAARRKFLQYELNPSQIVRVNAFADTRPLEGTDPKAQENQRMAVHLALVPKLK